MRRLVGLIALFALIYGAWWLTQNDFDLRKVPILGDVSTEVRGPVPESDPAATSEAGEAETESLAALVEQSDSAASSTAETGEGSDGAEMAPDGKAAPAADMVSGAEAPAPETEVAVVDPGAGESGAEAPASVPSFDIVRVEPTGETVLAGIAEPLAMVEVLNGVEPVATAEANERGEWALVFEEPLPPGTHDLGIRATSPDQSKVTLSDQRVAVLVPESPDGEPLVVLNDPDTPSRIIQIPSEGNKEIAIAATPESGSEGESVMAFPTAPQTPELGAGEAAKPSETAQSAAPDATAGSAPSMAIESAGAVAAPSQTEVAAASIAAGQSGEPDASGSAESEAMKSADGTDTTKAGDEQSTSAGKPSEPTEMAAVAPAVEQRPAAPEPPRPDVGVAAVEAETNGALYIAGTATTSESVRVYVNEEFIGEASPTEGGTWLLKTMREMAPAEYTIRADQVDSGGAVIARAEVPFEREIEVASLKTKGVSVDASTGAVAGRVAAPETVIIKQGDNLWRISRKLYGYGIRYSTIYQANRDQIRKPELIYPGQVFVLPTGDTNWDERE